MAKTILCIASYFKGIDFLVECKRLGCKVILLTSEDVLNAEWPRDDIDEVHGMPDLYDTKAVINGVSYLARTRVLDTIVALDDFDVEMAARLREHLRIPGMGDTTARYFRDKLAMRVQAKNNGIKVPEFIHVLNHDKLSRFMKEMSSPWVLKPRSQASAIGIKKIKNEQELWQTLESLGDRQSFHLLEQYIGGDVYHVDSIVLDKKILFSAVHQYLDPPMNVAHEGGIFVSCSMKKSSPDAKRLLELNKKVIKDFGLRRGVTHTEFIKSQTDGEFYFLETAARVGGANIAELIEAATGINLWKEWAKLETAGEETAYLLPKVRNEFSGIVLTLSRQENPDTTNYNDPEIYWRLKKKHHVGLVVRSKKWDRVNVLIQNYSKRFQKDFHASLPPLKKASY